MSTIDLARSAARAAARVRADLGVGPAEGVCPFDIAEGLEVPVRFVAVPSLEGMYSPDPKPTIIVNVERPPGRRRYTCGHEIGHHVFGHGARLDELVDEAEGAWSPEEYLAQRFAAALMMPKIVVDSAFARRGWSIATATAEMFFVVAQELGVGFTTLLGYLERTLRCLSESTAAAHRRVRLPKTRKQLAGFDVEHDLVVVDEHWGRRTVDVEVGDVILVPESADVDGECASLLETPVRHVVATAPGMGTVSLVSLGSAPRELSLRVSRREFTGLARYRHLEEVADE